LPKDKLYATIYTTDDEAEGYWRNETDIDPSRIQRFDDNFWEMGDTGPCGPCSEIHIDRGPGHCVYEDEPGHTCAVNADGCGRYVELWNLVFMENNRESDGSLTELPAKNIDTGMGFERIVAVIQGVKSNYDTDVFQPLIQTLEKMSGRSYAHGPGGTPFRVIADHVRSLTFAITDGSIPSNEGRGYVLRRLLRRAYRFGRELGFTEPFIYKLVPTVVEMMGAAFPEITERVSYVQEVVRAEEERFGQTLEQGLEKFNELLEEPDVKKTKNLPGAGVFMLYDTYGFPMDLTRLMAAEKGFTVDEEGFARLMEQQRERARDAARKGEGDGLSTEGWRELAPAAGTTFVGYDMEAAEGQVYRYKQVGPDEYLLSLDTTPFYAESGGQVGDRGVLVTTTGKRLDVVDTIKWHDATVHRVKTSEPLQDTDLAKPLKGEVAHGERTATRRNHSATHLLQAALRKVLGDHIQQSGSRVDPGGFRFDFTHFKALTDDELGAVERQVNEWILENLPVVTEVKAVDEAKQEGAIALFGEKYGDTVRVVTMDAISKELCGGTHVSATGQIGMMRILSESSIAAGVRRIEATTGLRAFEQLTGKASRVDRLCGMLKVNEEKLEERVTALLEGQKALEDEIAKLAGQAVESHIKELFEESTRSGGAFPWLVKNLGALDKDSFARLADMLSDELRTQTDANNVFVLGARVNGKAQFAACAADSAVKQHGIHCGELVKAAAAVAGGGGGGRPNRAQAGGRNPEMLDEALVKVTGMLKEKAGGQ
ncbi:MAG: alanine--tRNA ligase, partial [Chitinivibrionales bacterium]|nr:alanine--tRNA ligase [Chitinivibrionales bacterium]